MFNVFLLPIINRIPNMAFQRRNRNRPLKLKASIRVTPYPSPSPSPAPGTVKHNCDSIIDSGVQDVKVNGYADLPSATTTPSRSDSAISTENFVQVLLPVHEKIMENVPGSMPFQQPVDPLVSVLKDSAVFCLKKVISYIIKE